jgi:hypothetical protein
MEVPIHTVLLSNIIMIQMHLKDTWISRMSVQMSSMGIYGQLSSMPIQAVSVRRIIGGN